jgi:hypothetical protein
MKMTLEKWILTSYQSSNEMKYQRDTVGASSKFPADFLDKWIGKASYGLWVPLIISFTVMISEYVFVFLKCAY